MTPARAAAALAALVTALLLQATVVGPALAPLPVSLPAVLVAAVALQSGAGTGLTLGFATGLIADLGSHHPAGVLALSWLGLGMVAGMLADRSRRLPRQAALAGMLATLAASLATLLLTALGDATAWAAVRDIIPTLAGDLLLAFVIIPVAKAFLRSPALRGPRAPTERRVHLP